MSSSSGDPSNEGPYKPPPEQSKTDRSRTTESTYWSKSLRVVTGILSVWAFISLGCGVLFRDWLDAAMPNVGGAPFGFWMAQQGSIIGFLILLFVYMLAMNRMDRQHGYGTGEES